MGMDKIKKQKVLDIHKKQLTNKFNNNFIMEVLKESKKDFKYYNYNFEFKYTKLNKMIMVSVYYQSILQFQLPHILKTNKFKDIQEQIIPSLAKKITDLDDRRKLKIEGVRAALNKRDKVTRIVKFVNGNEV